jgi:signal transduction histidine kinase
LTVPAVLITLLGCSIFNFIILEEQRRLFSNEIVQRSKQEEMMKIVDMFHGTVFIVEPNTNTILFEKKVTEALFNIINKVGDEIREDRIY